MENTKNKGRTLNHHGVNFYHLKGKFAVVNNRGDIVSDFNLTGEQVSALYKYLDEGVYKGMFDEVDRSVYRTVLGLAYDAKSENVRTTTQRKMLIREFIDKLNELDTYQKGHSVLVREGVGVRQPE